MKTLVLLSALVLLAFQVQADPIQQTDEEAKTEQQPGEEDQDVLSPLGTQMALFFKIYVSAGAQCDGGLEFPEGGLQMSPRILVKKCVSLDNSILIPFTFINTNESKVTLIEFLPHKAFTIKNMYGNFHRIRAL